MTEQATDNATALDAFLAAKAEIDAMLERLAALSADNFETNCGRLPDQIITLTGSGEPGARPA